MASEHRSLRFSSLDDAMAEVERLVGCETKTTGSFSLGQILEHLARTLEIASGKRDLQPPAFPVRLMARVMRPMALKKAMTGLKLPAKSQGVLWPSGPVETEQGWAHLRDAVSAFRSTDPLPKHPIFGTMTPHQHEMLQCRHFEGHLGFVHPV